MELKCFFFLQMPHYHVIDNAFHLILKSIAILPCQISFFIRNWHKYSIPLCPWIYSFLMAASYSCHIIFFPGGGGALFCISFEFSSFYVHFFFIFKVPISCSTSFIFEFTLAPSARLCCYDIPAHQSLFFPLFSCNISEVYIINKT